MAHYQTLNEAVNDLLEKGYTTEMNLTLEDERQKPLLRSRDFKIDEVHLFDETGNPGEEVFLIAVSSKKNRAKVILINAFVSYTVGETTLSGMLQNLKDFLGNLFIV